jgi:hypothetical protein
MPAGELGARPTASCTDRHDGRPRLLPNVDLAAVTSGENSAFMPHQIQRQGSRYLRPRRVLARIATEVLAPWVWVMILPLAIAWHATSHPARTLLWGLIVGITGSIVPMAVIVRGARLGRWQSHHVHDRAGRLIPFVTCIGSLAAGWMLLMLGHAPHELVALAAAMLATLLVGLVVTLGAGWKVSMHAAVSAGAVVILTTAYGPWALLLAAPTAWVMWSRVELRDHTSAQVLVGAVIGVLAGGLGYRTLEAALA